MDGARKFRPLEEGGDGPGPRSRREFAAAATGSADAEGNPVPVGNKTAAADVCAPDSPPAEERPPG